ncbi:MAG TPA: thioredoxin family protein [Pusillimonas sp.]|jgi:thioredoxin 1|uniref:thioredoxin family protein n=1 Tax=unclassified Pusillimonas TaxID=2640016 RepID=UPI0026054B59|nr:MULTISPECIES: thioredoxin family protein [unclassified Pusillimonas]HLU20243.1 thioredoxin family protein [Pusillimonas sp.]
MPTYDPQENLAALRNRLKANNDLLVVCYCAQWCDTCGQYRHDFSALAERHPQHVFIWVDIEEQPELLGDEDVENFPTLLLQKGESNLFFGTQLPYIGHLEKLLDRLDDLAGVGSTVGPPPLRPLLEKA